ncbi:hypothetical protein V7O66_06415 [Methanolobus sp. ZRKC3]|uniref:hypothetical protein n=1 Tax=Methanolobus sp. ZRKC3 TaxID=3125786 RepID=UPI003255F75F
MKRDGNAFMGILVLITIIVVMLATFSLGCAENPDKISENNDVEDGNTDDGNTDDDNSNTETGQYIRGTAVVEDVEILILESFPVQIHAVATGYLPDGCTEIDDGSIEIELNDNTFDVTIETIRPKDMACTEAIVPFEQKVVLDVYGLEKGVYTVNINGIESSFELATDNSIPE